MKFTYTKCTEELLQSLDIPLEPDTFFLNPINLPCAYEAEEKILLVQYPELFHWPQNALFRLYIGELWLSILKYPSSFSVGAYDTEEYFNQDYLLNALNCSFRTIFEDNEIALKFDIRGRSDNEINPEAFLVEVGGFSKLVSESKLIDNLIKPNLPRVRNVDSLTDGKLAIWNELSLNTKKLLIDAIEKYKKKLNKKDSVKDIVNILEQNSDTFELLAKVKDASVIEYATDYYSHRKNGVWFKTVYSFSLAKRPHTFIGGIPELSSHTEWPYDKQGHRAFFIGQIDCAEIGKLVPNQLPESGILYFFSDQSIEEAWDVNGTKCYVFHRQLPTSIITTVPDDYPKNLEVVELVKRQEGISLPADVALTWPRMDLHGYRFATFISSYDYISENFPDHFRIHDAQSVSRKLDKLIDSTIELYIKDKELQVFGKKKRERHSMRVFPKSLPNSINFFDSDFKYYEADYPWTRLHIFEIAQKVKQFCLKSVVDMIKDMPEVSDLFDLKQRYMNKNEWGYHGIKSNPDFLRLNNDLNELFEQIKVTCPSSYDQFVLLLDAEKLYDEAHQLTKVFHKNQLFEATVAERDEFVNWLSGWINYCACFKDYNNMLHNLIKYKNYPLRQSSFEIDTPEQDKETHFHFHFSKSLQFECMGAFDSANKKLLNKAPEFFWRVCKVSPEDFSKVNPSALGMHKALGYGTVVQHAASKHRDKVLLLEVMSDANYFSNFGDGALQFWISADNLKAGNFSEAFITAECT